MLNARLAWLIGSLSVACGPRNDGNATDTQKPDTPVGVVSMGARVDSPSTTMPPPPPMTAAQKAEWLATADSVMRVHLDRSLFLSPRGFAEHMSECSSDAGSDNPTIGIAAARARIVGRDSVHVDWAWDYQGEDTIPMRSTVYAIEITSAALMIPNWIAQVPYRNDTIPGDEAYVFEVGPRVDTLHIHLEHFMNPGHSWPVCAPVDLRREAGKNFISFVHDDRYKPKAIQWKPADASWSRIRALADSLKAP